MIPLYGFLEGDVLGLVILAREDQTLGELAWNLCVSAQLRVEIPEGDAVEVVARGQVLDLATTVREAGLEPLERIDVRTTGGRGRAAQEPPRGRERAG